MTGAIEQLYAPCPDCGGHHLVNVSFSDLDKEAARIARELYAGTFEGVVDSKMTLAVARHLTDGITEGTGAGILTTTFGSPDYNMLANLESSVYHFAGAKNYHQLKAMTMALKDDKGNIRPFADFKADAMKVNKVYNQNWLKTEYQTAINSSQSAARWKDYQEDKDVMPYLRYETVGDDRVRDDHTLLDGVVRRVDDPFWDKYNPPNGFNCRCTTSQQAHGPITNDIQYPNVNKMFQTNLGKDQLSFPKGHPYYSGLPKKVKEAAAELQKEATKSQTFDFAKATLLSNTISRAEVGGKIGFTSEGLLNAIEVPHPQFLDKVRMVASLDKVLEKGVYQKSVETSGEKLHYFATMIRKKKSWIVVKETADGERVAWSIVDKIK